MRQLLFFIFSISLFSNTVLAQKSADCIAAKDSMKAQFARGEIGCYITGKNKFSPEYYVQFSDTHYEKRILKKIKKDSVLLQALKKQADKSKIKPNPKPTAETKHQPNANQQKPNLNPDSYSYFNPNDTSSDFKYCYNMAFKAKLDSAFKCDFFKQSDSIMRAYDKAGKGYKNAMYPGGDQALQKYLDSNVTLPEDIKLPNGEKTVKILYSFFVDETGKISDVKLAKSNCNMCENAVLQAVQKLPNFSPAIEAGKPKKVKYILPYTKKI